MDWVRTLPTDVGLALVGHWIEGNPPYRPGYWKAAWASYCVSTRVVAWMQWLVERDLDGPRAAGVVDSLVEQLRFLEDHLELDVSGNHVIRNVRALLWGGAFFEGADADRWRRVGEDLLEREIDRQILPDGTHYERSPYYHAEVFGDLLECHRVTADGALRDRMGARLDDMASALVWLTGPDGRLALFKDGGERGALDPRELWGLWRDAPPGGEGEAVEGARGEGRRPGVGSEGNGPARGGGLPDAGYHGVRTPGLGLTLFAGPVGAPDQPGHGHADIFSFELAVGGVLFCVDTGTATYDAGPLRDRCRSTRAHNTVTIDGRDQAELWAAFRVGRRFAPEVEAVRYGEGRFELRGSFDGWAALVGDGLVHRREVRWEASERVVGIRDSVTGRGDHVVEASIHLHPDVRVRRIGADAVTLERGGRRVEVRCSHALGVEAARYFPAVGVAVPNEVLRVKVDAVPCTVETRLAYGARR
jgi:uncharacterized heparinase superfamily protein